MKGLARFLFFIFMVLCVISGLPLLIIPGRFLQAVGWAYSEPMIIRLLGAALLAFGWGAWRSFRAAEIIQFIPFIEMSMIFTLLGSIGWLRHLLVANYWPSLWAIAIGLLVLGLLWIFLWLSLRKNKS